MNVGAVNEALDNLEKSIRKNCSPWDIKCGCGYEGAPYTTGSCGVLFFSCPKCGKDHGDKDVS